MSEERETPPSRAAETPEELTNPGAPVAETASSDTDVLRAVERAHDAPTAAEESATMALGDSGSSAENTAEAVPAGDVDAAELARRQAISDVDTQLDMAPAPATVPLGAAAPGYDDLPTAAAPAAVPGAALPPARDGEIRISADHPMAALYMQTPMPPEIRGNRGAGVLIALLATLTFAALYLGAIALWIAPSFPPSQYVDAGLMPWLTSWTFIIPVVAFFVGLTLLVLIVGRAGWWSYVLGGFFVALLVGAAGAVTLSLAGTPYESAQDMLPGFSLSISSIPELVNRFALTVPVIAAAAIAREVTVWFGAWIGFRGRRMKLRNAEALAEYETALAESQAKQA